MDHMVVSSGFQSQIPWSANTFPVTMTWFPAQRVIQPEYIQPWGLTGAS